MMMKGLSEIYNEVETSTDVMGASSHKLIQLMMDKCLQHIEVSKNYIMVKDDYQKNLSIAKALDIVEYLRLCLNHNDPKAEKLASMLDALYAYLQKNLVQANMNNDIAFLDEAKKILSTIKEGWDGIG